MKFAYHDDIFVSVPPGGTTDQVLTKASDTDGDVKWADVESGGFSPTVSTSINENQDGVNVTITDVNGEHSFEILNGLDGENGENGQDATINGENTIEIVAGENVTINQESGTLTISATGGGSGGGEVYSTEETRIGTWVDGRPLYRKVLQLTMPSKTDSEVVIGNLQNVLALVHMYGVSTDKSGYQCPEPFVYPGDYGNSLDGIYLSPSGGIMCKVGSQRNHIIKMPVTIIAEYTKTTDQATIQLDNDEV